MRKPPAPATMSVNEYRALESEEDFQAWVIGYAREHGWRVAHFRPSRTKDGWRTAVQADGKGFPDLVLARLFPISMKRAVIFAEVKSQRGPVSDEQQAWLDVLGGHLWRPSDRAEIEELLA